MTTARLQTVPPVEPNHQEPSRHGFFAPGDLFTWLVLTGLLLIAPLSLAVSDWPLFMNVVLPIAFLGVIFGLILARSRYGELLALVISATYGVCLVLIVTSIQHGGGLLGGSNVFSDVVEWVIDAQTGGINPEGGDLVFTLLVATLFWFLGYNSAWHTFRIDRVWRVVLPPGLILASNMVFADEEINLDLHFAVYLFLAFLLVIRSNLNSQQWKWYVSGITTPKYLRSQFILTGAGLALMILLAGWIVPTGNLQDRLDSFQEFLNNDPLQQMSEFWNRLFSPVESLGPTTADYYGGDTLDLGGAIRLGDQPVLYVEAPTNYRYYWRSRIFDIYHNGRWTPAADIRLTDSNRPFDVQLEPDAARSRVVQDFTVALNSSRLVYTAPQPLSVNLETRSDLFYTAPEGDPARAMNISVIRPQKVLRRGDTYTATSVMSIATAFELRLAGQNYPSWVTDTYLQVSSSVTPRTIDLARQVVADAGASNPYDQAKAIETYLRQNIAYNEAIPRPPANQDPVDWVLFDFQQGYCNYYATSMVVMLRSLGIPARMAAGFSQGEYDTAENQYVVTERDAHTWVEAYFPGFGWIEFEPTSAEQPLQREGDEQITPPQVAPQTLPTETPTPTPMPTATPAPTSTPSEGDTPPDSELPTPTPTITPSPTPTPTVTPVIVPTQPPPMQPQSPNPLELILPALGVLLAVILFFVLLLILGAFIYWWWEWRGMRGLSPISRAYARLERYAALIGFRPRSEQTTEERRDALVRQVPQAERPITAISRMYTVERYGRQERHPAEDQQRADLAERAWPSARKSILRRWANRFRFWRRD